MNKKEQMDFAKKIKLKVKEKGFRMGFFLTSIEMSPTHWHFILKGERPLTDDKKNKIEQFLKS